MCCVIPEELQRPAALRWLFLSTKTDSSWFHIRRHCFETPLSSFPSLGKFSFSQSRLPRSRPVVPKLWPARSNYELCASLGPREVACCPAAAQLCSLGRATGRLQPRHRAAARARQATACCLPWSLTQHSVAISPRHTMPDTFAGMWQPLLLQRPLE